MRRLFTIISWLLFSFLFALVLLLGEINFYVAKPAFIKDALRENNVYTTLVNNPGIITGAIKGQPGIKGSEKGPLPKAPVAVDAAQADTTSIEDRLSEAFLKSVDAGWLARETEKAIDAGFEYATTEADQLNVSIDLRGFKVRLRQNLNDLVLEEYNKLPEVPIEQFDQEVAANPGKFPSARPAGYTLEQTLAKTGMNPVEEIMAEIPDVYEPEVTEVREKGAMNGIQGFKQAGKALGILNFSFWVVFILTLALLLLFAKLTAKTWLEFLMRLGIFLTAALVSLAAAAGLWFALENILLPLLLSSINFPTTEVKELGGKLAAHSINRFCLHLVLWSAGLSIAGIATVISTGIVFRRRAASTPTQ